MLISSSGTGGGGDARTEAAAAAAAARLTLSARGGGGASSSASRLPPLPLEQRLRPDERALFIQQRMRRRAVGATALLDGAGF